MRKINLWKVELTSAAGGGWEGVFVKEPSVAKVKAALWLEIEELRTEAEDPSCDEENGEYLCHQEEQARVFHVLAEHLVGDFCARTCDQVIEVAKVNIGSVQVERLTAYTTEAK